VCPHLQVMAMMAARAFLTPKSNSFAFEDRLLVLDSPVKVGRSHKDDRSDSGNCFFDCKVLSRAHAKILYDEGRFYLVDTGSSNGSFVNNIRLSKCGEESKVTQLYTGDLIRFGSDVMDKAKNVTQKCIVARLKLFYPDGTECETRPASSRLFRPVVDNQEDVNGNLKEALAREKALEEQLAKLTSSGGGSGGEIEKVMSENSELGKRLSDIEKKLEERERFCSSVMIKKEEDAVEIAKLRQLIDNQNADIANLENALSDTQTDLERAQVNTSKGDTDEVCASYEAKIKQLENSFDEERTKIRQQLHDVSANEINLLNRIKSLESEQEYAQAEVDKIVVKESDQFEHHQELEYKVECLTTELQHTRMLLEQAEASKVAQRSDEDIEQLKQQDEIIAKTRSELAYVKNELIESRSKNAASEDDLNTVKGTVETMTNAANALNNEIETLNLSVKTLTEELIEMTNKATHLESLVAKMEAAPEIDAQSKIEITDLKSELSASQVEVKAKVEDIINLKELLRLEKETVQQKDIDISRLNGQVNFIEEEMEQLKINSGDVNSLQAEINSLRNKLNLVVDDLEVTRGDNVQLSSELQQQQLLYSELKKMRGRGEELDLLQQAQRDVVQAREMAEEYQGKLTEAQMELTKMGEEKMRLLRENAQIRSCKNTTEDETTRDESATAVSTATSSTISQPLMPAEAVMSNIGNLKLYEILLGLLFLSVIISWNPYIF